MPEATFNDFNWHDSRVLKIELGLDLHEDERFEILLELIEDYDTHETSWKRMKFLDGREIRINGHLGFRRGNSIQSGEIVAQSELLSENLFVLETRGLGGRRRSIGSITISLRIRGRKLMSLRPGFVLEDEGEKRQ
jgi:hypothetical protein